MKRKLSAILSADVSGYSQLMGRNEEATVQLLLRYRNLIADRIQACGGRVVDTPGDNVLAEFSSAVDAVESAVEIQEALAQTNAAHPSDRRMHFRMGINIGDVLSDEGRIYGDGVNIAARIEQLADPGGICISRGVYDQVHQKVDLTFTYIGERQVKNISEPVRVYKIDAKRRTAAAKKGQTRPWHGKPARTGFVVGALLVLGVALWFGHQLEWAEFASQLKRLVAGSDQPVATGAKPSIAVLPFQGLSASAGDDYFGEGITSDIITDLSKFSGLAVIASNTVFTYRHGEKDAREIGRELDVDYILEGSFQKRTDRLRLNAKLVDARQGLHIWAERYDRRLKGVFDVQDELVHTIVGKMAIQIQAAETAKVGRKPPEDYSAYEYLLKGSYFYRRRTRPANYEARQLFLKALEIDPDYVEALVALGWTYIREMYDGWTEFPNRSIQQAFDLARGALAIDETVAGAHALLAECYLNRGALDLAQVALDRALELNPNSAGSLKAYGALSLYSGDTGRSIVMLQKALRLDPNLLITSRSIHMELGLSHYLQGRYGEALKVLNQGVARRPHFAGNHIGLAATYARLGQMRQARQHAAQVQQYLPFFDLDEYGTKFLRPDDRERIIAGLRLAGL